MFASTLHVLLPADGELEDLNALGGARVGNEGVACGSALATVNSFTVLTCPSIEAHFIITQVPLLF